MLGRFRTIANREQSRDGLIEGLGEAGKRAYRVRQEGIQIDGIEK